MDLANYTFLTALILAMLGFLLTCQFRIAETMLVNFPRSQKSAIFLLCCGLFWFLFRHVSNLGEADFGDYKLIIGLIGIFIGISSYFFISDFLSVRALCILVLFYSREVLDSAFLQEPSSRLFLVSITYLLIVASLYFGAWPYRLRDFISWLLKKRSRSKYLGTFFLIYSCLLFFVKYTY